MDTLLHRLAMRMVDDNRTLSPDGLSAAEPYLAMENARKAANACLERLVSSDRDRDELWRCMHAYADYASYYFFYEGAKAGAQLYRELLEPTHVDEFLYK